MRSLLVSFFLLSAASCRLKRAALNPETYPESLWSTERSIPYVFHSNYTDEKHRQMIQRVIEEIQSNSCLQFELLDETDDFESRNESRIQFCTTDGYDSYVFGLGKSEKATTEVWLSHDAIVHRFYSVVFHELLHALGLYHTQSRVDRDDFVLFNESRTDVGLNNYEKQTEEDASDFNVPYDFGSIMHYANSNDELMPLDELFSNTLRSRSELPAFTDYLLLNRLYRCEERCASVKTVCENGGFVDPNDCQGCICANGFGGAFCDQPVWRPQGPDGSACGGVFYATDSWQNESLAIEFNENEICTFCVWHLKASIGKRIEIRLLEVTPSDCSESWMEIQLKKNLILRGYRFDGTEQLPTKILTSEGDRALVSLYSSMWCKRTYARMEFRSVVMVAEEPASASEPPSVDSTFALPDVELNSSVSLGVSGYFSSFVCLLLMLSL